MHKLFDIGAAWRKLCEHVATATLCPAVFYRTIPDETGRAAPSPRQTLEVTSRRLGDVTTLH